MTTQEKGARAIRVGLVGTGYIARFHVQGLRHVKSARIVGVADQDKNRAEQFATTHRITDSYHNVTDLCRAEAPDVIHVLTPPSAHAANALEAISHDCHVLIEKPFATSVDECNLVIESAQRAKKLVCIDHSLLFDPFVQRALRMVKRGMIGQVVAVEHCRSQSYPPYAGGPRAEHFLAGGNPFRDVGYHSVYLVQRLLGEIEECNVVLGNLDNDGSPRVNEWKVSLRCQNGLAGIYLSWRTHLLQNVLWIHGTDGVVCCDIFGMSVTARRRHRIPEQLNRLWVNASAGVSAAIQVGANVLRVATGRIRHYHGLQKLVQQFYEAMTGNAELPVPPNEARSVTYWTEQVAAVGDEAKERYEARFLKDGTARVLVTGATGFIGRALVRRLIADGQRVRILTRRFAHEFGPSLDHVEQVLGDLGSLDDVRRACGGIDTVYHLGATISGHRESFECATIQGTRNIIDACLIQNVRTLLYMSSLSVLHSAAASSDTPINEQFPLEPTPERRGLYSYSKWVAEHMVREAMAERGLDAVILRPGEVLGREKLYLSGAVGRCVGSRIVVVGNGQSTIPLIWIDDLVDAIVLASKNRQDRDAVVFHLVDPENITQDQFAAAYLRAQCKAPRLIHVPIALLFPLARLTALLCRCLAKSPPMSPYRLRSAIGIRTFDCSNAIEKLLWRPQVGARQGLDLMGNAHGTNDVVPGPSPCLYGRQDSPSPGSASIRLGS